MNKLHAIYGLVLRHQLSTNRMLVLASTFVLFVGFSGLVATSDEATDGTTVEIIGTLGLAIVVPIISLVLASAAIGEWIDDETLVYIWLRPVSRNAIALAATAACLTVSLPATVAITTVAAAIGGSFDTTLILGAAVSTTLATIAYTSVFVALGALTRWALISGFVYIFVWEGIIANFGAGLARLSIRSYAASSLERITGVTVGLGDRSSWATYTIPLVIVAVGVAITTLILDRKDVP